MTCNQIKRAEFSSNTSHNNEHVPSRFFILLFILFPREMALGIVYSVHTGFGISNFRIGQGQVQEARECRRRITIQSIVGVLLSGRVSSFRGSDTTRVFICVLQEKVSLAGGSYTTGKASARSDLSPVFGEFKAFQFSFLRYVSSVY